MFGVCKYHKKTISLHQRMTEKSKNKVYINMYVEFNKKSHNYQPTMKYYALSHGDLNQSMATFSTTDLKQKTLETHYRP